MPVNITDYAARRMSKALNFAVTLFFYPTLTHGGHQNHVPLP